MHGVDTYERIRRAFYVQGWSLRRIAKEYGHDRRLIRKAIAEAAPEGYRRTVPSNPAPDPIQTWIEETLRRDRTVPRKQRHTAKRIYDRLVEEQGYAGGESTVRRQVVEARRRLGIGAPEVYVPLDHPPGRDAEVDWGDAVVKIGGEIFSADVLSVRASHSGALFVQAFPIQRQEAFFEGMRRAFEYFGGVFHLLKFDNLTTAVKKVLQGRGRQEQEAFIAFRSHYLYEPFFCIPGQRGAHEKGGVEGGVGYSRRNWLVPVPDFPSWDALNAYLREKCLAELTRTAQGKTEPIGVLWERERPLLLPLPSRPYDCCRKLFVRADSHSRVHVDGIRYSVPAPFAYRPLTAKVYVDEIAIAYEDKIVARHRRRFDPGAQELDPIHYLPVLSRKPHLLEHGLPFTGWRLPPVFHDLRRRLEASGPGGLKEYVRVLQAIPACDVYTVAAAVAEVLASHRPSAQAVLERLAVRGIDGHPPAPSASAGTTRPSLNIADPNVRQYDRFLQKEIFHGNDPAVEGAPQTAPDAHDGPGLREAGGGGRPHQLAV